MMGWFWTAWGFAKSLTGGGLVGVVSDLINKKRDAKTEQLAIESTERIEYGRTAADYHKDANKYHSNRWIRPTIIAPFAIYIWAAVVLDAVLGVWVVKPLHASLFAFMTLIGSFYFGWRPVENFGRDLLGMRAAEGERDWDAEAADLDKPPRKRRKRRNKNK